MVNGIPVTVSYALEITQLRGSRSRPIYFKEAKRSETNLGPIFCLVGCQDISVKESSHPKGEGELSINTNKERNRHGPPVEWSRMGIPVE